MHSEFNRGRVIVEDVSWSTAENPSVFSICDFADLQNRPCKLCPIPHCHTLKDRCSAIIPEYVVAYPLPGQWRKGVSVTDPGQEDCVPCWHQCVFGQQHNFSWSEDCGGHSTCHNTIKSELQHRLQVFPVLQIWSGENTLASQLKRGAVIGKFIVCGAGVLPTVCRLGAAEPQDGSNKVCPTFHYHIIIDCDIRQGTSSLAPSNGWQWSAICNTCEQYCTVNVKLPVIGCDHNLDRD